MRKNKKLLAVAIFAIGFLLGIAAAPYLNKGYIGADSISPDPTLYHDAGAQCVRYDSYDSSTDPPAPHKYECWETFVEYQGDYGPYTETTWQCYNDGVAINDGYLGYPAGGCGNPTNTQ